MKHSNLVRLVFVSVCLYILYRGKVFLNMGIYEYGFPGSSAGKESTCNAGDPDSIPGSFPWRSDRLPTAAWASLEAQTVNNPPAMRETPVRFLGQEDSLEESMATHSCILAWRIPVGRGAWWATVHGVTKRQT